MTTSDENEISDICTKTKRTHMKKRMKPHRLKAGDIGQHIHTSSSSSDACYDDDPPYTSPFPSNTSQWNTDHLDALRIFYDKFPTPIDGLLDKVYKETGMSHPLTEAQKDHVKKLQDLMTFSCEFSDVLDYATMSSLNLKLSPNVFEDIMQHLEEKDLLWNENTGHEGVQDFVTQLLLMIEWMKIKKSSNMSNRVMPDAAFKDLFKAFIRMCGLVASDGSLWKSKQFILGENHHKLNSEADICISLGPRARGRTCSIDRSLLTLVSIARVKNFDHIREDSPEKCFKSMTPKRKASGRESSECERDDHLEPSIFQNINKDILGQHGSDILAHIDKYGENLLSEKRYVYRPGVIVIGTKVTLTLLVCSVKHLLEIKDRSEVDKQSKAVIYYSDQKDLLKKDDRDLLIESFARLKNYCSSKLQD